MAEAEGDTEILLDYPDLVWGELPEEAALHFPESPRKDFQGEALKPKDIRQFLWEHRNNRVIQRDRAFIWKKYAPEMDSITVGLGTLTVAPVVERLSYGS